MTVFIGKKNYIVSFFALLCFYLPVCAQYVPPLKLNEREVCVEKYLFNYDSSAHPVPVDSLDILGKSNPFRVPDTIRKYLREAVQEVYKISNHSLCLNKNEEGSIATIEILPSGQVALYACTDSIRTHEPGMLRPHQSIISIYKKIKDDFSCLVKFRYGIENYEIKIPEIVEITYINTPRTRSIIMADLIPALCDIKTDFYFEVDSNCVGSALINVDIYSSGKVRLKEVNFTRMQKPNHDYDKELQRICTRYFNSHLVTLIKRPREKTSFFFGTYFVKSLEQMRHDN